MARFAKLSPVLLRIGERLDTVCPMKELSDLMGLSEDSFYRFFKKTVGAAPKEYERPAGGTGSGSIADIANMMKNRNNDK